MKDAFEFEFMHGTHRWSIFFKSHSNPIKGHLEEGKKKKKKTQKWVWCPPIRLFQFHSKNRNSEDVMLLEII